MTSLTKTRIPQAKNFFRVQTKRLATSFETFTRSVEHTRPENSRTKPHAFRRFFSENPRNHADATELSKEFRKKIFFNIVIHSAVISQKLNGCILKHTVIKFLCCTSTKDILKKMFALSNVMHRNYYHSSWLLYRSHKSKKQMPKSHKMRYHCQVLVATVDLNKYLNRSIID